MLYRKVGEWDYTIEWQCLTCKKHFHTTGFEDIINFCPFCGVKFSLLWTKRNKRYYDYPPQIKKSKYKISYEYMRLHSHERLHPTNFHPVVCNEPDKTWQVYVHDNDMYLFRDKYHLHIKEMFKCMLESYKADRLRIFIERPDGTKKEIILK